MLRESVALPQALMERSERLLRAFDWTGVAMVEYKREAATGTDYLMEVNGRFWGSLQLAVDAGVDFPARLVDAALGSPGLPDHDYLVGVRTRWFWGDVDHLIARLTHSRDALGLDHRAPGRTGALLAFLRAFLPPAREEVFRLSDPRPALRETAVWLGGLTGGHRR